jgi:hypothetical protein
MYAIKKEIAKDEGLLDKQNKKLVGLNKELDIAQKSIQNQIDNIKIMGKDKDGWDLAKTKLEAYNTAVTDSTEAMKGVLDATATVESDWKSINDWLNSWLGSDGSKINLETIHTITTVYVDGGAPGYVPPGETPQSLEEAATFDAAIEALDAAQAAIDAAELVYEGSVDYGTIYDQRNAGIALAAAQEELANAQKTYDEIVNAGSSGTGGGSGGGRFGVQFEAKGGMIKPLYRPMGGIIPYFLNGGFAKGTDTVPAMLTPGEFIMSKYAVQSHGIDTMKAINSGKSTGGAVYNNTYALTVNAKTDASPNEIAQAVMSTIKQVDDRRIRGVSLNGR